MAGSLEVRQLVVRTNVTLLAQIDSRRLARPRDFRVARDSANCLPQQRIAEIGEQASRIAKFTLDMDRLSTTIWLWII